MHTEILETTNMCAERQKGLVLQVWASEGKEEGRVVSKCPLYRPGPKRMGEAGVHEILELTKMREERQRGLVLHLSLIHI